MNIVAVDWAITKELPLFNGIELTVVKKPEDIVADLLLIERGVPYGFLTRLPHVKRILFVDGKVVKEFRDSWAYKKSDTTDVDMIFKLYERAPEKFTDFSPKDESVIKIQSYIKEYRVFVKTSTQLKNIRKAMQREFLRTESFEFYLSEIENEKNKIAKKVAKLSSEMYPLQYTKIAAIPGVGSLSAGMILGIVGHRNFDSFSKFEMFCGLGHTDNKKYSHVLKGIIFQCVRSAIMTTTEPYNSIYREYKERKLNEGMTKGHANNLGRRKAAQKILKEIYKILKEGEGIVPLDEFF